MNDFPDTSLHTEEPVGSYFEIENHLVGTRTADVYKAIDITRNQALCVWLLRKSLPINSDAVVAFLERMNFLEQIEPRVSDLVSYAVDSTGVAFAVFPAFDGQVISDGNLEPGEVERRLIGALRLMERVHQAGLVLGDICHNSFWIDRQGSVKLIGLMGECASEVGEGSRPPHDTLYYLAPEQAAGQPGTMQSDVFAFGILTAFLFYHVYPFPVGEAELQPDYSQGQLAQLVTGQSRVPVWVPTILERCLQLDPAGRYVDAEQVLDAIGQIRELSERNERMPVQKTKPKVDDANSLVKTKAEEEEIEAAKKKGAGKNFVALAALGVGVLLAIVALKMTLPGKESEGPQISAEMGLHQAALSDDKLKEAINVLSKTQSSLAQKAARYEHLANSDDPVAHDVLVESALSAQHPDERRLAERAILDRARRLGLVRTAEQAQVWLNSIRGNELPQSYSAVLRALNATLPEAARIASIQQVAKTNLGIAKRMAAALVLDSGSSGEYHALLFELVGQTLGDQQSAQDRSELALIMSDPELAMLMGTDVIQRKEDLSDQDIVWLLKILADRDDLHVRAIANTAMERSILSPLRASYLTVVRDRPDLPPDVMRTIVRAASGVYSTDDIITLGRWYDLSSESVLLAISADSSDPDVLRGAFDSLAAKSISVEPARSLVDWVRKNYWEERVEFVPLIGTLANVDKFELKRVEETLDVLKGFTKDTKLIDILLESGDPVVARVILEDYADVLGIGRILNLLGHSDREVRIAAIGRLIGTNNLGVAKIVLDHYETEKDPEIRKLYAETFWFVQRREGGVEKGVQSKSGQ